MIPRPPDELTLTAIGAEVMRARVKFPGNVHLLAALLEACGELAKALLEQMPKDEIDLQAIQVAAVAVRIIEEGDSDFELEAPPGPVFAARELELLAVIAELRVELRQTNERLETALDTLSEHREYRP